MTDQLLSQVYLKLDGADAPAELLDAVEDVCVESSLHLPDMLTLTIYDPQLRWVDSSSLFIGRAVVVEMKASRQRAKIFDGEIVEVELQIDGHERRTIVRAFDRLHRLARGTRSQALHNVSDADLVRRIAELHGLRASSNLNTQGVHDYVLQACESDLTFLQRRAAAGGYLLYVEGTTLHYEAPGKSSAAITLRASETLLGLRARASSIDQVDTVTVRGWDFKQVKELVGRATTSRATPVIGISLNEQKKWFGSSELHLFDCTLASQESATRLAQAALDRRASRFVEAEGVAVGEPRLVAGVKVKLEGVGTRFSGEYFVTSATHRYRPESGYQVEFSVSGANPATLLATLLPEPVAAPVGLMPAVVVNVDDPDKLGRVKVRLAWLGDSIESNWARVVVLGGGALRGFQWMPEVNDEVLVGFAQGDLGQPYVLGGLWNGKSAPPSTDFFQKGKVVTRLFRSSGGHEILFDDDASAGGITIKDKAGNTIALKAKDQTLTVTAKGDLTLDANGALTLKAKQGVSVSSDMDVQLTARQQLQMKGSMAKLEGSGTTEIKGGVIKLN